MVLVTHYAVFYSKKIRTNLPVNPYPITKHITTEQKISIQISFPIWPSFDTCSL